MTWDVAGLGNAIMDALGGNGGEELGIPATPHRIWQALQQR